MRRSGWERLAVDACGIAIGTAAAFVLRAAIRRYDSLGPAHLAEVILPALPLCLLVGILCLASSGAYRAETSRQTLPVIAGALAWAAAPLGFIASYWGGGPETPFLLTAAGYVFATVAIAGGRRLREPPPIGVKSPRRFLREGG